MVDLDDAGMARIIYLQWASDPFASFTRAAAVFTKREKTKTDEG